jgi:hypothetical protein
MHQDFKERWHFYSSKTTQKRRKVHSSKSTDWRVVVQQRLIAWCFAPLRVLFIVRSVFLFCLDCLPVVRRNRHTLCQVLACATWQCVWLLSWLIFSTLLYQLLLASLSCPRRVLFEFLCPLSKVFRQS